MVASGAPLFSGLLRAEEGRPGKNALIAYVGTYSSPLHDVRPTQVDLPPGNGRGIHLFEVDRATGAIAARVKTGGDRVTNAPLSVDGTVYVITDKGDIAALRGAPVAARAAKSEPAAAPSPPAGG